MHPRNIELYRARTEETTKSMPNITIVTRLCIKCGNRKSTYGGTVFRAPDGIRQICKECKP